MTYAERGSFAARAASSWRALPSLTHRMAPFATVLIFVIALASRLLWPGLPINVDEELWMQRGAAFAGALIDGNLAGTYQRQHPGVTNMWSVGGALSARYLARGLVALPDAARDSADLRAYLAAMQSTTTVPLELYSWVRTLLAVITAALLAAMYALGRRLFGKPVALSAVTILLFEPFFLAYQRSLTTDAYQAGFTWLALLAYLLYLKERTAGSPGRRWLLLSGACFGLALLSKVSAALSLPAVALWAAAWSWRARDRQAWARTVVDLLLWGIIAGVLVYVLWPALWANPERVLARFMSDMKMELSGHRQFFMGQTTSAPGPLFYPLALLLRVSPALLLGSALGAVALFHPALRRHVSGRLGLLAILLDVGVVMAGLTLNDSKLDRYLLTVFPGLGFLAAAGFWAALPALDARRASAADAGGGQGTSHRWLAPALAVIVAAQLAVLLPHFPYNLTYFNPLVGGPPVAYRALMVGNGELLDQAAAWLNSQPGGAGRVASFYPNAFAPYYRGTTTDVLPDFSATTAPLAGSNYVVLYANQFQRGMAPASYFESQRPLFTVRAHGVDYARVYRGPAVRADELAAVPEKTDLDFGGRARLLGYELETPQVAAGENAVVDLYWQAEAAFPADDYVVYLGLLDAGGVRFGAANSLPVGGHLKVGDWQAGEVIRDVQRLQVLPGTPPGKYQLQLGFYSPGSRTSLPIGDANRAYGSEVPLATLEVTRTGPLQPGADLGIARQIERPIALAPDGPTLLGYDWSPAGLLRPGDAAGLALLWQAGSRPPGATELYLQLAAGGEQWRRAQGHPLGGIYPAGNWQKGELVRDAWNPLLPADAPAGRYAVTLLAHTAQGDVPLLDLGLLDLAGRAHSYDVPNPTSAETAHLGGVTGLLGYDLPLSEAPGAALQGTLYWQAQVTPERSYVRFVHLLNAAGQIVTQSDGPPGGEAAPTAGWLPGEYVTDHVAITLPPDLAAGTYRWQVGLYDPVTGQRLTDPAGRDAIQLQRTLAVK